MPQSAMTVRLDSQRLRGWYQQHLDSLDPARPEMTQEEINEEIRQARAERKARSAEAPDPKHHSEYKE